MTDLVKRGQLVKKGEVIEDPNGSDDQGVVGFDCMIHWIRTGERKYPRGIKYDLDGYKRDGIVEAIFLELCKELPFREMLESYGVTEDDIKGTINWALYYHCGLK